MEVQVDLEEVPVVEPFREHETNKMLTFSYRLNTFLIAIKKVIKKQVCNPNVILNWYYIHWNEKGN